MLHDASVEVTCDWPGCRESIYVNPPYVYMSTSGAGGHYDTSDKTLNRLAAKEGWRVDEEEGETARHFCEGHAGGVA
jgi:hypothetical protein